MGDIKKPRKKFSTPNHPWQKQRIDEEGGLMREYGVKNKKELWKVSSFLKKAKAQAKKLITDAGPQAEKERKQMGEKLSKYGLVKGETESEEILGLSLRDVFERRLQTILLRKNMARTVKQARQFIVHRHVAVAGQTITSPSYMVTLEEEQNISFNPNSQFTDEMHPERIPLEELRKQIKLKTVAGNKSAEEAPAEKPKKEVKEEKPTEEAKEKKPKEKPAKEKKHAEEPKKEKSEAPAEEAKKEEKPAEKVKEEKPVKKEVKKTAKKE